MKPFVYYSSDVVKQFVADSLNRSMDDLVVQLESYVVTGLKGGHCQLAQSCRLILFLPRRRHEF